MTTHPHSDLLADLIALSDLAIKFEVEWATGSNRHSPSDHGSHAAHKAELIGQAALLRRTISRLSGPTVGGADWVDL